MSADADISTSHLVIPASVRSTRLYRRLNLKLRRRSVRRRVTRLSLLGVNVLILALIVTFVLQNQRSTVGLQALALPSPGSATPTAVNNPLDQLSSADIAQTVAETTALPERTAVENQAQTQAAEVATASITDNVVAKPQVVETALKSRADIQNYVTEPGDTIASIAAKFGITSDSIRWSNGLTGSTVSAGVKLVIPPVPGIVYTVKNGDTPASLATRFKTDQAQIIAYNDAEISGLQVGEQIIIPGGSILAAPSYGYGGGGNFLFTALYGGNGYDFGYCTWYVATQVSVPSNWGNASSWAYYARLSGWNVSSAPGVGAIAQTPYAAGGEGHVAIVDGVSADGSQIHIRDMNDYGDGGGFDRVGSGWVPTSVYPNYITH